MPNILESGASASIGQSPDTHGLMSQRQSPSLDSNALKALISSGAMPPELLQSLVSFGSSGMNPSLPPKYQPADIQYSKPQGSFATVGERKRADEQALFHGIAGTVKSATDFFQQKKTRAMQIDTERLMGAMTGYTEAQSSGNKEAMQHNSSIINDMMSDPKKVKQFEKVFNVNLLGESKDKNSPEYKGFITAFQKFKDDKAKSDPSAMNPSAQKLMQAMPQRLQADPRLQELMAATKAGVIPSGNVRLQQQTEMTKVLSEAQQKGYDRESKEKISETLAGAKDRATQATILKSVMDNTGRQGVAEIVANASRYRADKAYQAVIDNPRWDLMKTRLTKDVEDKSLKGFSDALDKQLKSLQADKKQVDAEIKADKSLWFTNKDLVQRQQQLNKKIDHVQKQQSATIEYYMQKHDDGLEQAIEPTGKEEIDYTPEEMQQLEEILK